MALTGPLAIELASERETRTPRAVLVQQAGYLMGGELAVGASLAAGATLQLRFDGAYDVDLSIPGGGSVDSALAAAIELVLRARIGAAAVVPVGANPVPDAARLDELGRATVRWEAGSRRLYVVSGRYGAVSSPQASRCELRGGTAGSALGLTEGRAVDGRAVRHQIPPPRAMNLEVRLDLWAASQVDLGAMIDSLLRAVPARGHVPTRAALIAADLAIGATSARVVSPASPTPRKAMVHLEGGAPPRCRVTGEDVVLAGASWGPLAIELPPGASASVAVLPPPLLPDPLRPPHPCPRGFCASVELALPAALADGEARPLLALTRSVEAVERAALRILLVGVDVAGTPNVELRATADLDGGGGYSTASTTWRVPASRLAAATVLHAAVHAAEGSIQLFLDGVVQDTADIATTPTEPVRSPGESAAGDHSNLVLGGAGPGTLRVGFVLGLAEPFGPADPRLRSAAAPASRFAPGDRIQIATTTDGFTPADPRHAATIEGVSGDLVSFSPASASAFTAGRALLLYDDLFVEQLRVSRKDDLLNRLYRASVDYRVAAVLEDELSDTTAPLVETPLVNVVAVPPPRPAVEPTPTSPAGVGPVDLQHPGSVARAVSANAPPVNVSPP